MTFTSAHFGDTRRLLTSVATAITKRRATFARDVVALPSSTAASIADLVQIAAAHAATTDDVAEIRFVHSQIIDSSAGIGADSLGIASNLVEVTNESDDIAPDQVGFVANPARATT